MQFSRPLLLLRQNPGQWRGLGSLPFEQFFILTDTDVDALHGAGQSKEAAGQSRQCRCASKQPTESDGTEIASPPNGLVGRGQTNAPTARGGQKPAPLLRTKAAPLRTRGTFIPARAV